MNDCKQRTVSLPTNYGVVKLQFTKKCVSSTIRTRFTVPAIGRGHEITQVPSSLIYQKAGLPGVVDLP